MGQPLKKWKASDDVELCYYIKHHHIFLQNNGLIDLRKTFENGQVFHYRKINEKHYEWISAGRVWSVLEVDDFICFENVTEEEFLEVIVKKFDLDVDYDKINKKYMGLNKVVDDAIIASKGMRILYQEPWEVILSFIISSNNNIPKIQMSIRALCEKFGSAIDDDNYDWPSAEVLAKVPLSELRVKALGYRDKYIKETSAMLVEGVIDINSSQMDDKTLMQLSGVGQKVADCILLFGYHQLQVVPVDTWVKKIGIYLFDEKSPKGVKHAFHKAFGNHAGVMQQYLFHYFRNHPELL